MNLAFKQKKYMSIQLVLNKSAQHGVPVKVFTKDIEREAIQQLRNLAQLEFVHHHIAAVSYTHLTLPTILRV